MVYASSPKCTLKLNGYTVYLLKLFSLLHIFCSFMSCLVVVASFLWLNLEFNSVYFSLCKQIGLISVERKLKLFFLLICMSSYLHVHINMCN
jgi:hypothetical protein